MLQIPVSFPSEYERLRRAIEADRGLSFRERIQAIDGLWNAVDLFVSAADPVPARDRLRQQREEESHRCFREFIERQLACQPTCGRAAD